MANETPKGHMTFDQIVASVTEIAQDSDDRDRFKALKMLASLNQATTVIPDPLQDGEIIERLYRVMRPCGHELCQIAYRRAFPGKRRALSNVPKLFTDDLTEEQQAVVHKVRSLKSLYRMFPEMSRPGFPPGYPVSRGPVAQMEWCRRKAAEILIDRERNQMIEAVTEEASEGLQEPRADQEPSGKHRST